MVVAKKVLVIGLGVGGMATAIRLKDAGWEPVIVERSAERRTGGYFVGLFPEGKEAARRLGVLDTMHLRTAVDSNTWEVNDLGDRARSAGFLDQPGSPEGVLRGDIEAALWERVDGRIEVRYDTVPVAIRSRSDEVSVTLRQQGTAHEYDEVFDLLVGADGLRSTVRREVFGPHEKFMVPMNRMICAFQLTDQLANFDRKDGVVVAEKGRALWVFPLADRTPTALLTYEIEPGAENAQFDRPPVEVLRDAYEGMDGHGAVSAVLAQLEHAPDHLFDAVYKVEMPALSSDRVVLVGDAAWCMTLYSGMGASSAMIGAVALGDALEAEPADIAAALTTWEATMRTKLKKWRSTLFLKSQVFIPSNGVMVRMRSALVRRGGRAIAKKRRSALAAQRAAA